MRTAHLSPAAAAAGLAPVLQGPVVAGRVVAVLNQAVYLRCPRGMVALLGPQAVAVPVGLRPADGLLPALAVGDPVQVGRGRVQVVAEGRASGPEDEGPGWWVGRWWRSAVRPRPGRPTEAALERLGRHLPALPDGVTAALPDDPTGLPDDPTGLPDAVRALVGLGEGLTPLGDDVLAGLLVAWAAWPQPGAGRRPALAVAVEAALPRTTAISAELLRCAVVGHAAAPVLAAVDALASGDPGRIDSAATDLLAVGHSSGTGLGHGLVWGLSAGACRACGAARARDLVA